MTIDQLSLEDPEKLAETLPELKTAVEEAYAISAKDMFLVHGEPLDTICKNLRQNLHGARLRLRFLDPKTVMANDRAYDDMLFGLSYLERAKEDLEAKQFVESGSEDMQHASLTALYYITNAPEYPGKPLSLRAYNSMHKAGYIWIRDILAKTWSEIQQVKNLGKNAGINLLQVLEDFGLEIMEAPNSYREGMKDEVTENTRISTLYFITNQATYTGTVMDTRIFNALKRSKMVCVKDVLAKSQADLEKTPYIGQAALETIVKIFQEFGFPLRQI